MRQAQWRNVLAHAPKLRHDSFPIKTPTKIHGALDRNTDERPISMSEQEKREFITYRSGKKNVNLDPHCFSTPFWQWTDPFSHNFFCFTLPSVAHPIGGTS
jgi:hypothetical protein